MFTVSNAYNVELGVPGKTKRAPVEDSASRPPGQGILIPANAPPPYPPANTSKSHITVKKATKSTNPLTALEKAALSLPAATPGRHSTGGSRAPVVFRTAHPGERRRSGLPGSTPPGLVRVHDIVLPDPGVDDPLSIQLNDLVKQALVYDPVRAKPVLSRLDDRYRDPMHNEPINADPFLRRSTQELFISKFQAIMERQVIPETPPHILIGYGLHPEPSNTGVPPPTKPLENYEPPLFSSPYVFKRLLRRFQNPLPMDSSSLPSSSPVRIPAPIRPTQTRDLSPEDGDEDDALSHLPGFSPAPGDDDDPDGLDVELVEQPQDPHQSEDEEMEPEHGSDSDWVPCVVLIKL